MSVAEWWAHALGLGVRRVPGICTRRPRRLVYPGTEDCAGCRGYGFHVKEQLRPHAVLVLLVTSAAIGLVAWWLT